MQQVSICLDARLTNQLFSSYSGRVLSAAGGIYLTVQISLSDCVRACD